MKILKICYERNTKNARPSITDEIVLKTHLRFLKFTKSNQVFAILSHDDKTKENLKQPHKTHSIRRMFLNKRNMVYY